MAMHAEANPHVAAACATHLQEPHGTTHMAGMMWTCTSSIGVLYRANERAGYCLAATLTNTSVSADSRVNAVAA